MSTLALLNEYQQRGVLIRTDDGKDLIVTGDVDERDCNRLRAAKPKLLTLLTAAPSASVCLDTLRALDCLHTQCRANLAAGGHRCGISRVSCADWQRAAYVESGIAPEAFAAALKVLVAVGDVEHVHGYYWRAGDYARQIDRLRAERARVVAIAQGGARCA